MKDIIPVGGTALQANTALTDDIFSKWLHYTDVMPKSHATYTRAIKMFIAYLRWNRIDAPTRDDIITYRDLLKKEHKPSTVRSILPLYGSFSGGRHKKTYTPT